MANRHLIAWLLDLDLLERHELRGLDLDLELALDVVLLALLAGAFNKRVELLRLNDHVDLEAAEVAG